MVETEFRCSECGRLLAVVESGSLTVKCPRCKALNIRRPATRWNQYTPKELDEIARVPVDACPEGKEPDWFAVLFSAWSQVGLTPELEESIESKVNALTNLSLTRGVSLDDLAAKVGKLPGVVEGWRNILTV